MKVFVDTAAWIALFNRRDDLHDRAIEVQKNLRRQKASLVTTEFVFLEVADAFCNLSRRTNAIQFIDALLQLPQLEIVQLSHNLLIKGWQLYKQRPDKEWSLTDCTSFVVMTEQGISQAFTSDRHFEQAGFSKL